MPSIRARSFPRRSLRRQFVVLALVCLTVIFAGRLRALVFGPHLATNTLQPKYPIGSYNRSKQSLLPSSILGEHRYLPNGLLLVNNAGPHPIYELIRVCSSLDSCGLCLCMSIYTSTPSRTGL